VTRPRGVAGANKPFTKLKKATQEKGNSRELTLKFRVFRIIRGRLPQARERASPEDIFRKMKG